MKLSSTMLGIIVLTIFGFPGSGWSAISKKYEATLSIDWKNYERTPEAPHYRAFSSVIRAIPCVNKFVFYGNWGGLGNKGGKPIDAMDELYRRHDAVYALGTSIKVVRESDAQLVAGLKEIDPATLSKHGQKYRKRAIKFFSSPVSKVVGKPVSVLLRKKEKEGSAFPKPQLVAQFFKPHHSGIPNVKRAGLFKRGKSRQA
ncbi:MAG: hypothetical protein AAGH89_04240 [Verrucomicrobiota bacterium]